MAKIPFTKLNLKKDISFKYLEWENQKIEIKQYLPIEKKLEVIAKTINFAMDEHVFVNPCKLQIYEDINIILEYTNINLTDKQAEDILKLYDLFTSSNFTKNIYQLIPREEVEFIHKGIIDTIHEIYEYKNSFAGMIEQTQNSYKDIEKEVTNLQDKLSDDNTFPLLKDVITKLN